MGLRLFKPERRLVFEEAGGSGHEARRAGGAARVPTLQRGRFIAPTTTKALWLTGRRRGAKAPKAAKAEVPRADIPEKAKPVKAEGVNAKGREGGGCEAGRVTTDWRELLHMDALRGHGRSGVRSDSVIANEYQARTSSDRNA